MAHRVTATFQPEQIVDSRYTLIFANLAEAGIDVDILPAVDPRNLEATLATYKARLAGSDLVSHLRPFVRGKLSEAYDLDFRQWIQRMDDRKHKWSAKEFDELSEERIAAEGEFLTDLDDFVLQLGSTGTILDTDIGFPGENSNYALMQQIGIPHQRKMTVEEWENDRFFPAIFKEKGSSRGQGIWLVETEDQYRKLFDPSYIVGDENSTSGRYSDAKDYFDVSEFVECPSEHFTHYRVVTIGDGTILGAVLSYSDIRKDEDTREINDWCVYDNPDNPLFLNRRRVVSNRSNGGLQIPLDPGDGAKEINAQESEILRAHGISAQQLPPGLERLAIGTAKAFGSKGLYTLGQDWIQSSDTQDFSCLEVNYQPQFGIFDTCHNYGKCDEDAAQRIGAERISEGIIAHLEAR